MNNTPVVTFGKLEQQILKSRTQRGEGKERGERGTLRCSITYPVKNSTFDINTIPLLIRVFAKWSLNLYLHSRANLQWPQFLRCKYNFIYTRDFVIKEKKISTISFFFFFYLKIFQLLFHLLQHFEILHILQLLREKVFWQIDRIH